MAYQLLSFTVLGVVSGCVYALIATGLVVTYNTTGVFNFAHGAIAMMGAYTFWQLWQSWHVNVVLALLLVLLVIAPLFGLVLERVLMRPLRNAPVDVMLVVTLGLLLFLVGAANLLWSPEETRILPKFFNGGGFHISYVLVSWHAVAAVVAVIAVALALRVLFNRTRTGVAMRAVVDNADLLAMAGGRPAQVQQLAWMISCSVAALAGILLAPIAQLNIIQLTLLVVDGYAAAIIGRLRNLPLALAGALAIGLGQNYIIEFAPSSGYLAKVSNVIPIAVLFVVLFLLPQDRLRTASFTGAVAPRVASLRSSFAGGGGLLIAVVLISFALSNVNLRIGAQGFALAIILLSLLLLTGYGGMISACQLTFAGFGALAMSHFGGGGSLLGILLAILIPAGVGAVLALPTLKMRGLYLALATFAFAAVMDLAYFAQVFGSGGTKTVNRPHIPGIPTTSDQAFLVVTAVAFVALAIGVLALRRSPFGRRLVAVNDSPAACATLGVDINRTKLAVFTAAAGMAGLGGALLGGVSELTTKDQYNALFSLVALLLARVGGINTASGVLVGAFTFALFPVFVPHLPSLIQNQFLLTGLAAVSVGRDPNGLGGRIAQAGELVRKRLGWEATTPAIPVTSAAGTAAAVFLEEESDLVGASH